MALLLCLHGSHRKLLPHHLDVYVAPGVRASATSVFVALLFVLLLQLSSMHRAVRKSTRSTS
jgi:hypothetical protein